MKIKTFYEPFTDCTFLANEYDILETMYLINQRIASKGYAHLNDFRAYLDIPQDDAGEITGWTKWVDFSLIPVKKDKYIKNTYVRFIFSETPKQIRKKRIS